MICPICNAEIDDNAIACPFCGNEIPQNKRDTAIDTSIRLPAALVQFLNEYHSKGESDICITRIDSYPSHTEVETSSGDPDIMNEEVSKTIYSYFRSLIDAPRYLREYKTAEGEFTVSLADGTYKCVYTIRTKGSVKFPNFVIKFNILERIQTSTDIANTPSPLERLIQLADHQEFQTAIECIPEFLKHSLSQLQVCQENIKETKSKQIKLEAEVESAINTAQDASRSSKNAWFKSADVFHRKHAIEALQQAGSQMGDALVKTTDIHLYIIESQTALLESQAQQLYYQKLLMDISKGLLLLGSYNQQTNKALYQELKKQLNNASEKELGELGMRELQSVAAQLKEHQDMLSRMDAMEKKLSELTEIVNKLAK